MQPQNSECTNSFSVIVTNESTGKHCFVIFKSPATRIYNKNPLRNKDASSSSNKGSTPRNVSQHSVGILLCVLKENKNLWKHYSEKDDEAEWGYFLNGKCKDIFTFFKIMVMHIYKQRTKDF